MYDIVFISYQEPNADKNWQSLVERFPTAKRVHGIKGIHQAHIAAANLCLTKMFWVVDGDAVILDTFDFRYKASVWDLDTVHVWKSQNPVNDLIYGYGGVKLLPRQLTTCMNTETSDMTTSISNNFKVIDEISNLTEFNTDPFNTWKSAFRECAKLSSKIIDRQDDTETETRLKIWCSTGIDKLYGEYSMKGAVAGTKYGKVNQNNLEALKLINDFEWLKMQFKEEA